MPMFGSAIQSPVDAEQKTCLEPEYIRPMACLSVSIGYMYRFDPDQIDTAVTAAGQSQPRDELEVDRQHPAMSRGAGRCAPCSL